MKICMNCGAQMDDSAVFCTHCGAPAGGPAPETSNMQYAYNQVQGDYANAAGYGRVYDHTAEFTQKDIHENKVFCLAIYLMGAVGIIIAMLGSKDSPYTAFHVREAIKISIAEIVTGIATVVLCWTILVPLAGAIFLMILFVVRIICFVRICKGKAIEAPIVREIGFLN